MPNPITDRHRDSNMIPRFADSYFVVTFQGEVPQSTIVKGWQETLEYIFSDECLGESVYLTVTRITEPVPDHTALLSEVADQLQTWANQMSEQHQSYAGMARIAAMRELSNKIRNK